MLFRNNPKKHVSSHNVISSLLATGTAGSCEFGTSPDPLPHRQVRKRELMNTPTAPDESEPRRKVMRLGRTVTEEAPSLSSLLLSTPALPDSKLPLPSKLPLRPRVRAESLPESAPPTDTSTLLDPRQTETDLMDTRAVLKHSSRIHQVRHVSAAAAGAGIHSAVPVRLHEQWCPAVGARGSATPIVFQLVGAPLPYFVNIFELVNDKYCTI